MTEDPTERGGLPSASMAERLAKCPGSVELARNLPDVSSSDSERGTRIHGLCESMLDDGYEPSLSDDSEELEVAERLYARAVGLFSQVIGTTADQEIAEERMFLHEKLTPIFSGQADVIWIKDKRALLCDYKTGWAEVDAAPMNHQLLALAVLLEVNYGPLDSITVAIIQPCGEPVMCEYDAAALATAERTLRGWLAEAAKPDAKRIASSACKYCKAQSRCPEFQESLKQIASIVLPPSESVTAKEYTAKEVADAKILAGKAIAAATKMSAWCDIMAEQIRLERPEEFNEYFELQDSEGRDTIINLETVHERFVAAGVSTKDFMATLTPRKGVSKAGEPGLEKLLQIATGTKGKGLKEAWNSTLAGCIKEGAIKQVPAVKEDYKKLTS